MLIFSCFKNICKIAGSSSGPLAHDDKGSGKPAQVQRGLMTDLAERERNDSISQLIGLGQRGPGVKNIEDIRLPACATCSHQRSGRGQTWGTFFVSRSH